MSWSYKDSKILRLNNLSDKGPILYNTLISLSILEKLK
jgi:hypothetical protein